MQNATTFRQKVQNSKDRIQRKRSGHRASRLNTHKHPLPYLVHTGRERSQTQRNVEKTKREKRSKTPETKRKAFVMRLTAEHFYRLWPRMWENSWSSTLTKACLSLKQNTNLLTNLQPEMFKATLNRRQKEVLWTVKTTTLEDFPSLYLLLLLHSPQISPPHPKS